MAQNYSLLKKSGFNLETAVFLAQASEAAYTATEATKAWTAAQGFVKSTSFDSGNVQGFWCSADDVALLVFRGTSNPGQWLRDVRLFPASHPWGHVHIGFLNGVAAVEAALTEFDQIASRSAHVWVAGHSLGGALALVAAARLKMRGVKPFVFTFGQPRVGLRDFAERYSIELPERLWRFVNQSDIVTRVPPEPIYRHTGIVKRIVRPGVLESMAALESLATLESLAPQTSVDNLVVVKNVVAGGAALESAAVVDKAEISQPLVVDTDVTSLTELEFSQLQLALGAATESPLEQPALEGIFPLFDDHAIAEYIRLLMEIRASGGA